MSEKIYIVVNSYGVSGNEIAAVKTEEDAEKAVASDMYGHISYHALKPMTFEEWMGEKQ